MKDIYDDDDDEIIDECLVKEAKVNQIDNIYKISKGTLKIEIDNTIGSGFFLKFKRNNKPFYCIMTNNHVITSDYVDNNEKVTIIYENETKKLSFRLDPAERIIQCFKSIKNINIDVTIVEIIEKDGISNSFFLEPNTRDFQHVDGIDIQIVQYPGGEKLSYSNGKMAGIYPKNINMFYHDSGTEKGSSGSPIVLKGEETVIAIHKGKMKNNEKNVGIFIKSIIDTMGKYKKNGRGIEYYANGKKKYEGNFSNDKYEDIEAKFYYENGDLYIGGFKNGEKNGIGSIYMAKFEGHFLNDEYESGKLYSENREYYNGPFKNGKKEGKGVEYYKDGKIKYEGKFLDGKYEDDNGKYYYETGEIYTGQFKNGKIFGIGNKTKDNKVIHELKDGPDTEFDIIKRNLVLNLINIGKGIFNINCTRCNHPSKNHEKVDQILICKDCPEADNICMGRNSILK